MKKVICDHAGEFAVCEDCNAATEHDYDPIKCPGICAICSAAECVEAPDDAS